MPLWYWVIVAAIFVLGFLGAASIGLPFFALALFLVLRGIAGRPRRDFWPPVIGIVLFFVGFWGVGYLFGPVSCTTVYSFHAEAGPGETIARTTIDNTRLLGCGGAGPVAIGCRGGGGGRHGSLDHSILDRETSEAAGRRPS